MSALKETVQEDIVPSRPTHLSFIQEETSTFVRDQIQKQKLKPSKLRMHSSIYLIFSYNCVVIKI